MTDETSDAYKEGKLAASEGQTTAAKPYPAGSAEHAEWALEFGSAVNPAKTRRDAPGPVRGAAREASDERSHGGGEHQSPVWCRRNRGFGGGGAATREATAVQQKLACGK